MAMVTNLLILGLLTLMCVSSHGSQVPGDGPISLGYELKFVDTAIHPLAICNDGSPAAYYLYKGAEPTRWVFHQQGGWWCWDDYSCQVRWDHFANHTIEKRTLMSTKQLQALTEQHDTFNGEKNTGLMTHNSSNNPMGGASKVFLVYCSSDSHAGNRSAGVVPGAGNSKYHFRGKEIVKAVLSELLDAQGLRSARSMLLTGGSAGGMASLNNADFVADLLRPFNVTVVNMPDSGYFLDAMPGQMCASPDTYECKCAAGAADASPSGSSFTRSNGHSWLGSGQTIAQQAQAMLVYTQGLPDQSCAEFHGEFGAWRCYLGQYSSKFIETPTLLLQNQIDEWQGFWNGFFNYSSDPQAYRYAVWFRRETRRTLEEAVASNPRLHVFSPNCYHHGLAYDSIFWEVTVDGWTSASMLSALTQGEAPQLVMDACKELPCSPGTTAFGHDDCRRVVPPV